MENTKWNWNKKEREAKEKAKDHEICLGETDSRTSLAFGQNSGGRDGIQQSQDKETSPGKQTSASKELSGLWWILCKPPDAFFIARSYTSMAYFGVLGLSTSLSC